jgi:hypothetical protein
VGRIFLISHRAEGIFRLSSTSHVALRDRFSHACVVLYLAAPSISLVQTRR